jgi:fatty-acyl-CoA synthase
MSMSELRESRTVAELLHRLAQNRPEATAMIHNERSISYAELDRHVTQIANGLSKLDIQRQSRVGYLGKNSDLYFELLFGAARAGAALVPLNWRLAVPEIGAILADAGISALFVEPGFEAVPAQLDLPNLHLISMKGANPVWPDFIAWRDIQSSIYQMLPCEPEDTVFQMYTSGTTGLAKGVELSKSERSETHGRR